MVGFGSAGPGWEMGEGLGGKKDRLTHLVIVGEEGQGARQGRRKTDAVLA